MSTYTPGPWTVKVDRSNAVTVHEQSGNDLCVMGGNTNDGSNARLIAAAPDLLERLEELLEYSENLRGSAVYDRARAAIAKASARLRG